MHLINATTHAMGDDDMTNDDMTNDDMTNDDMTNDDMTNDDMTNDDMTNDDMAATHDSEALAHVHEANMQLRRLVHQFLTRRVTLTPNEALETQRELAALGLGTAWLHAKLQDIIASEQDG